MSAHNIRCYKENQNIYHIIIIKYAPKEVLCSLLERYFTTFFSSYFEKLICTVQ